ncbi:hypothetical protein NE237_030251 [Protea cynaroides]|uniref:Uncharacterized protein n=1 Tax=Protea cynaroides TaxID=273540 RepID=A0A9Q0JUN4_9MAGN|nr:hypothetical protein NE237_030251 [Protea cynaroides]
MALLKLEQPITRVSDPWNCQISEVVIMVHAPIDLVADSSNNGCVLNPVCCTSPREEAEQLRAISFLENGGTTSIGIDFGQRGCGKAAGTSILPDSDLLNQTSA